MMMWHEAGTNLEAHELGVQSDFLDGRVVDVWTVAIDHPEKEVDGFKAALDEGELARAQRLALPAARRRFIVGHGVLRTVIARYLDVSPRDLRFHAGNRGKPRLDGANAKLCFSLSYSGSLMLIAVATGREVGIDIERMRPIRNSLAIARRWFTGAEIERLQSAEIPKRDSIFLACWTAKEALLKARGDGLGYLSNAAGIARNACMTAGRVELEGRPEEINRWEAHLLYPSRGYVAALVAEGHGWVVRTTRLPI